MNANLTPRRGFAKVAALLVALVTHYGVDLQKPEDQTTGQEVIMDADGDGVIDDAYKKTGSVYYDESTGKYYMVQDDA
jgi:hypothetical protein